MKDSYWKRFLYFEKRIVSLETYIAFDQNNFQVFCIEILNLYLSICSEIEAIYKEILDDKSEINFNVFKEQFTNLENYSILTNEVIINNNSISFNPFITNDEKLLNCKWWTEHNQIKHNRDDRFSDATLLRLMESLSALFLLNLYLYFEKYKQRDLVPIPNLLSCNKFYIDNYIGGGGSRLFKFEK